MRFSNDGTTFSAWQPYAASAAWTLAGGKDGPRTVYAQFVDGAGNAQRRRLRHHHPRHHGPDGREDQAGQERHGRQPQGEGQGVASESLDPATVTKTTVTLKKSGKKIKATVSLTKGRTIVLRPKKPLADGTYKVTVTTKVTDLAGNAFDAKKKPGTQTLRWTFTV